MTAINHMLAGTLIVTALHPSIGLPLAFVSHFLLDMFPHYSREDSEKMSKQAYAVLLFDILAVGMLIVLIAFSNMESKWLLLSGGVLAIFADFMWVYRFVTIERFGKVPPPAPTRGLQQFHHRIQTRQSPDRLWIEAVVFIGLISVFTRMV